MRDLIALHVADAGGEDRISEAELSLIRRAATLTVELERLELRFANEDTSVNLLTEYGRGANTLRRLLLAIGLRRVQRDITPSPLDYARRHAGDDE